MTHARKHTIDSATEHSVSGLTAGHVMRAATATTFAFAAIGAADLPTAIDAAKIADGSVSNAEFQRLDGLSADIQGQLDAKMALAGGTFTGDVTMQAAEQLRLRDATTYFSSDNAGYIDAHAATAFRLTTTGTATLTVLSGNQLQVAGDLFLIDSGGDPRLVIGDSTSAGNWGSIRWVSASDSIGIGTGTGGVDTLLISEAGNVLLASTGQFQFGDTGTYIYQSADSILSYVADGRHEFTGGPVYVGSGSPGHTITGSGDLYVADRLEVDGPAYFDDQTYFYGLMDCRNEQIMQFYGSTFGGLYRVADDGLHFYVYAGAGSAQNRNIIICDYDARADDYDHSALSVNPTLFIQSDTRAGVATDEWVSFCHDQTDALYNVGTGTHKFGQSIGVTGDIAVSGTVDGVDVAGLKTAYDAHAHGDIYYTETEIDTWRAGTTVTEMGYLHGVTSDIQTQIDAKGGVLTKMLIDTYEGDNANNREIDLGDDYDEIHIYTEESFIHSTTHFVEARAVRTQYDIVSDVASGVIHASMASANAYWQGKMTGADVNKIKLGSTGNNGYGTNYNGWTYKIVAKKYSTVQTLP